MNHLVRQLRGYSKRVYARLSNSAHRVINHQARDQNRDAEYLRIMGFILVEGAKSFTINEHHVHVSDFIVERHSPNPKSLSAARCLATGFKLSGPVVIGILVLVWEQTNKFVK